MKKKLAVVLSIVMLFMVVLPGYGLASEVNQEQNIIDVTPSAGSTEFMQYWTNGIYGTSSTSVFVDGETMAYYTVDKHVITMKLERWTGSSWVLCKSWNKTEYNTRDIYISANYTIPSGYYYRVTTAHTVTNNGITETKATISDSILVD